MSGGLCVAAHCRVKSRQKQRGGVAVEFALVTPILIMLLMGTITTGLSYGHALGVTNAVREGARFGAIADASTGSWGSDVADRVHRTQFDDPASDTSICVELWKGPGAGTLVKSFCNASGPGVTAANMSVFPVPTTLPAGVCAVRVVATRNYEISAPPLLPPITRKMVRGSVARYEGVSC